MVKIGLVDIMNNTGRTARSSEKSSKWYSSCCATDETLDKRKWAFESLSQMLRCFVDFSGSSAPFDPRAISLYLVCLISCILLSLDSVSFNEMAPNQPRPLTASTFSHWPFIFFARFYQPSVLNIPLRQWQRAQRKRELLNSHPADGIVSSDPKQNKPPYL